MSEEHVRIQEIAHEACISAGWTASMEEAVGDRFADVSAVHTGRRAVIEVQLSPQDETNLRQRTGHYAKFGARTLWLVPDDSPSLKQSQDVASVQLANSSCLITAGGQYAAADFIRQWLDGRIVRATRRRTIVRRARRRSIVSRPCLACSTTNWMVSWEHSLVRMVPCQGTIDEGAVRYQAPSQDLPDDARRLSDFAANRPDGVQAGVTQLAHVLPYWTCGKCSQNLHYPNDDAATVLVVRDGEVAEDEDRWEDNVHWCSPDRCGGLEESTHRGRRS
jgi:hypothetical protein